MSAAGDARGRPPVAWDVLLWVVAAKVAIHALSSSPLAWGYMTDELYFLDCAERLDWGYPVGRQWTDFDFIAEDVGYVSEHEPDPTRQQRSPPAEGHRGLLNPQVVEQAPVRELPEGPP